MMMKVYVPYPIRRKERKKKKNQSINVDLKQYVLVLKKVVTTTIASKREDVPPAVRKQQ